MSCHTVGCCGPGSYCCQHTAPHSHDERRVIVSEGPGAYDRALVEATRLYGPGVELNQAGWSAELVEYEVTITNGDT